MEVESKATVKWDPNLYKCKVFTWVHLALKGLFKKRLHTAHAPEVMHIHWFHTFSNSSHFLKSAQAFVGYPSQDVLTWSENKSNKLPKEHMWRRLHREGKPLWSSSPDACSPNETKQKIALKKCLSFHVALWELFIPSPSLIFPIHLTGPNAS